MGVGRLGNDISYWGDSHEPMRNSAVLPLFFEYFLSLNFLPSSSTLSYWLSLFTFSTLLDLLTLTIDHVSNNRMDHFTHFTYTSLAFLKYFSLYTQLQTWLKEWKNDMFFVCATRGSLTMYYPLKSSNTKPLTNDVATSKTGKKVGATCTIFIILKGYVSI